MEQNSSEVETFHSLVNDLYKQESEHLLTYPFRGIKEIMPYMDKGKYDAEFMHAFMFPFNKN